MKYLKIILLFCLFLVLHGPMMAAGVEKGSLRQLRRQADELYYAERYPEALEYYIRALDEATREGDTKEYAACSGYIANVYDAFGDTNHSLSYLLKGYAAAHKTDDRELQSSFLGNIVTAYCRLGNVPMAKRYFLKSEMAPSRKDPVKWLYFLKYNQARIFTAEKRYDDAIAIHRQTAAFAREKKMKLIFELYQWSEIGNLYVRISQSRKALEIGQRCVALSRQLHSGEMLANAYKMLADSYDQLGTREASRDYRMKYFSLNDSVYNMKKFYLAQHQLSEYEERVNDEHLSSLHSTISQQLWVIAIAIVIVVILAILILVIFRQYRKLLHAQRLLISKNKEIEEKEKKTQQLLPDGEEKELLNKIVTVMEDPTVIADADFSLQALADRVASNTRYVSWVINDMYHKNFKTLLNEYRIREACRKLTDHEHYGKYTMQMIYEEVGYKNAVSFIRAFKKVNGMTPSDYQKAAE